MTDPYRINPDGKITAENGAIGIDLAAIKATRAEISDTELFALIDATYKAPQIAYGLLAWIEGTCDWELSHRRRFDYPLQSRGAAIDPSEDAVSIAAAIVMRVMFAQDCRAVRSAGGNS